MNRFVRVWLWALIAKTVLAVVLPFSNDEAYYWVWGHHLEWSYFDHPSMVGWLFGAGRLFENIGNGARLPGVWLAHLTLLIWNEILSPFIKEKDRVVWLLFVLLSPFFGIGSLVVTPDIPLIFFWSLSILLLLRIADAHRPKDYFLLGAALGLGFCSKYLIVLFVPIALIWLLWTGEWRRIRWSLVPLTVVSGLLFCMPVLYWNSQHDWESFKFQLNHGLNSEKWRPEWPLEYIGAQILILFPTVAWLTRKPSEDKFQRLLYVFGWAPIGFFFYTSFKARVEANWPIMAHPSLLALAFLNSIDRPKAKRALQTTAGIWLFITAVATSEAAYHWLPIPQERLKTSEFHKFDVFLPAAQSKEELFLGSYQMAAAISYKTRKQICKLGGLNRRDFYDFLPECQPKGDHFWLGRETTQTLPEQFLQKGFRELNVEKLNDEFQLVEVGRIAQGADR